VTVVGDRDSVMPGLASLGLGETQVLEPHE
jgi:hypothetical protein